MLIAPEMKELIDEKIGQVDYERKINLKKHQIMHRYCRFLAQIEVDKEDLIRSNFDWSKQPYFAALLTYLHEVHADRVAAEGKGPGYRIRALMPKFGKSRMILKLVLKYVIGKTQDGNLISVYNKVKQGRGNLDTFHDILAMASVLKDYLDIAAAYTPGGTLVDNEYLDRISAETEEVLQLEGLTSSTGSERSILVAKQNKLIILCLEAIDYIKEYARGAYFMNMNYFREHYTIHDMQKPAIDTRDQQETAPPEEEDPARETDSTDRGDMPEKK